MSYVRQVDVDDSNPFADSAVIAADQVDPEEDTFVSTSSKQFSSTLSDKEREREKEKEKELKRREEELARKEKELERVRMEQQQQQQQQQQQPHHDDQPQVKSRQSYASQQTPNWPRCKPIIYLSIKDDIDLQYQQTVNQLYQSWILVCVTLIVNFCGTLAKLIVGAGGKDFGFSFLYIFIIPFLAFLLWFRPGYNAYMKDSSFYFVIFFFFNGFHVLYLLYMVIGGQDTGAAGFINTITLFSNSQIGAGVVCLISLLFWIISFGFSTFIFIRVFRHFRAKGHTLKEARQQAFTSAAQSEIGQKAVSSAITGIAQGYAKQKDQV